MHSFASIFILSIALVTSVIASDFYTYDNNNNVHGRVEPRKSADGVRYLGEFTSMSECEKSCLNTLGYPSLTGESGCTSAVWHHPDFDDVEYRKLCYGVEDGAWNPTAQMNITTSQAEPRKIRSKCSGSSDCSYNGICDSDGHCTCKPQWMGRYCGQLNLVPTIRSAGLQQHLQGQQVSSWGGSALYNEADGMWHMWAAEMVDFCGIRVWISNSVVRHATSSDPLTKPFQIQEIVWPVFAHEPTMARAPSGEFVMFYTAQTDYVPCTGFICTDGYNGTTPWDHPFPGPCPNDQHCTVPSVLSSYMSYTKTPSKSGSWSKPVKLPAPNDGDTNLAPIILDDGSLVGLGRPPYRWTATNWRDVSTYKYDKVHGNVWGEDPFVWRESDVLHALFHGGGWDYPAGFHYWSVDGGKTWGDHNDIHAYPSQMELTTGGGISFSRRERPHLVFNPQGEPIALTNGVTPTWPCSEPNICPIDYCYTALQQLNTSSG